MSTMNKSIFEAGLNCASGGNGESRLFLRKDGEWRFPPLAAEQALHYLSQLIEGYREGMSWSRG